MQTLLITQNYFPVIGGVEIHARQVVHELQRQGHRVAVAGMNFVPTKVPARLGMLSTNLLTPSYPGYDDEGILVHSITPSGLDRIRMLPIAVRAIPRLQRYAYHGLNRFGYRFYRPVYLPRLRRLMHGCDVVHSLAGGYLGWTAQAAANDLAIPFVCTPFVHPKQWGDGPEDIGYYRRAQAVIGLLDTDKQYLASIGVPEEKLHVIGVSPDLPSTANPASFRQRYGLESVPIVLFVGRMTAQKGARAVLGAAEKVWQCAPETRFVFIGPASHKEAAAFRGTDARIRYLGKVSRQDKADALAACDVFCMPSISEILPTVYLEAWSYAKPVVGGRAHGLVELIEGNGAGLVASQQNGEVASALLQLLADAPRRQRLGERGMQLVNAKYSVQSVTEALVDLYQGVTNQRHH